MSSVCAGRSSAPDSTSSPERASIAFSQLAVLIAGMGVSLSSSALLTVCTLGIIPVIVVPVAIQAKVVMKFAERANESLASAGQTASETLLQLRTVAAFGLETRRIENFGQELALPFQQDVRKGIAMFRCARPTHAPSHATPAPRTAA